VNPQSWLAGTNIDLKDVVLNTAILTIVISTVWTIVTNLFNRLRFWGMRRVRDYVVPLGPYHEDFAALVEFRCLIVRFGTDSYIRDMASEREKYDGRLQNRAIRIGVRRHKDGQAEFELRLPVHRRLGTQFKCFAQVRNPDHVVKLIATLQGCDRIHDVSRSSSQFRERVYFLLKDFTAVETVDGLRNNMCFPE
jgi:hypothetical protein